MKPPAPRPVRGASAAKEVRTAQTAASNALPPSRRTCAPASAVRWWPAATTPFIVGSVERGALRSGDEHALPQERAHAAARITRVDGAGRAAVQHLHLAELHDGAAVLGYSDARSDRGRERARAPDRSVGRRRRATVDVHLDRRIAH